MFPPTDSSRCPSLGRLGLNRFARRSGEDSTHTGATVTHSQMWIHFHELVHYYLFAQPEYKFLSPEVYNINAAWGLNPADSLRNADNFVYYTATINAQCTDWPDSARENGRELLEDDIVPDLAEKTKLHLMQPRGV
ncbi:MAG: hypothetical protein Q9218_004089 [Villophora microphyllina]